jgi:acetyl-CoA carboxylase biotin carboxyl carrier protein
MPASVYEILIGSGDAASEGQEPLVLESMKMEIPVEAPAAGTSIGESGVLIRLETGA